MMWRASEFEQFVRAALGELRLQQRRSVDLYMPCVICGALTNERYLYVAAPGDTGPAYQVIATCLACAQRPDADTAIAHLVAQEEMPA